MKLVHDIVAAHRALPTALKLPVVAGCCFVLTFVWGMFFPLSPGPLCDEGMILFMEGGCDWGETNEFFVPKAALLVTTLVIGASIGRHDQRGFIPHLVALLFLATLPGVADGGRCDTYYGHPNGNVAQMLIEQAALGALVLASTHFFAAWRLPARLLSVAGVMLIAVAIFYAWLQLTPHWTWLHTLLVAGSWLAVAALLTRRSPPRAASGLPAQTAN